MKIENSSGVDLGLAWLRLGFGLSLAFLHGWQKLDDAAGFLFGHHAWGFVTLVSSLGFPAPAFFAVCAALAESIGSLLVACGLFCRVAAATVTATMTVAIYTSHRMGTPIEDAFLYAVPFAALALLGPGRFSLDHKLRSRRWFGCLAMEKGWGM